MKTVFVRKGSSKSYTNLITTSEPPRTTPPHPIPPFGRKKKRLRSLLASSSSSSSLWESIMQRHKRHTGGQSYSWSEHPVCLLQQKPLCYFIQMRRNKCRSAGPDCSFGKIPFVFQQAPEFSQIYSHLPSSTMEPDKAPDQGGSVSIHRSLFIDHILP